MFSMLRKHRRRRILAQAFPTAWFEHLRRNVRLYEALSAPSQIKLRDDLRVFIAERYWEGCDGLVMTDEIKVTVAAHACMLTLQLADQRDWYRPVRTVLVFPSRFSRPAGTSVLEAW